MKLRPDWVSGFVDGEGSFYVGINRHSTLKTGYQVLPEFRVVQHKRDIQVLYGLKRFFGCGVVRVNHDDRMEYRVRSIEHLKNIIIPFFNKHPLITKKKIDFIRFSKVINIMSQGEHLTQKGLKKIIKIVELMNRQERKIKIFKP